MSDDENDPAPAPAASPPRKRLTTSFPQLKFGAFRVGAGPVSTLPGLRGPAALGKALVASKAKAAEGPEEAKVDSAQLASDRIVAAARDYYGNDDARVPSEYLDASPAGVPSAAFPMLGQFLLTGSTAHVDTLGKALAMVRLCKAYGLCQDILCERVLDILKSLVSTDDVLDVIATVGHVGTVTEGAEQFDTFEVGDKYFFDFACDRAAEVFADNKVAGRLVRTNPLIAAMFLTNVPIAYEAKLPKPPAEEEEDE